MTNFMVLGNCPDEAGLAGGGGGDGEHGHLAGAGVDHGRGQEVVQGVHHQEAHPHQHQ